MRVGWGGEVQSLSLIVEDVRHRFYTVVEEEASEVLEALLCEPCELYKELTQLAPEPPMLSWAALEAGETSQYDRLKQSLKQWGTAYNVDEPWVYEDALLTLWQWSRVNNPRDIDYQLFHGDKKPRNKRLRFARMNSGMVVPDLPSFKFEFIPELSSRTLKAEKERFDKELREERERYFAGLGDAVKTGLQDEIHWPNRPHIRPVSRTHRDPEGTSYEKAPNAETIDLHLVWLVCYQIKGWSHEKICSTYLKDQDKGELYDLSNISKAVTSVAKQIELNLRKPNLGGRPKKS